MKTMRTMVAMLAVLAAMASCSKDPGDGGANLPEDVGAVMVSVSYPSDATRAVGDKLKDSEPMKMTSANIFFTDDDGVIIKHVGVGNENGSMNFTVRQIESGEGVIKNMTNESTKCHILANFMTFREEDKIEGDKLSVDLADGTTNISTVLDNMMTLNDINDDEGSVANLPLYGVGDVKFVTEGGDPISGTSNAGLKFGGMVDVKLNSLATRLQIGKITATPWRQTLSGVEGAAVWDEESQDWLEWEDAGDIMRTVEITEFEVQGIYINYFYGKKKLDPTEEPAGTLIDGKQGYMYYMPNSPNYKPESGGYKVYDQPEDAAVAEDDKPLTLFPDPDAEDPTARVWAYNLLPGAVPHIVVRFSKVVIKDSEDQIEDEDPDDPSDDVTEDITEGGTIPYFITVRGFNVGATPVTTFAVNNLYTLSNLAFNYTDLSEIPEDNSLNVLVNVEMMKWKNNEITWNKN